MRVWVYWNDTYSRITVGREPIGFVSAGPTDEGRQEHAESWWLEDGQLWHDVSHWERDCDGVAEWGGRYVQDGERGLCTMYGRDESCHGVWCDGHWQGLELTGPTWQLEDDWQRDHQAEAAGY